MALAQGEGTPTALAVVSFARFVDKARALLEQLSEDGDLAQLQFGWLASPDIAFVARLLVFYVFYHHFQCLH